MRTPGSPGVRVPADLRLVPAAAAAWTVAFLTLGLSVPAGAALAVGLGGAGLLVLALARPGRHLAVTVAAVLLVAATAGALATTRVAAVRAGPLPALADQRAVAGGVLRVTADPQPRARDGPQRGDRPLLVLRGTVEELSSRGRTSRLASPVVVLADERWGDLLPGERVRWTAQVLPARSGEPVTAVLAARGPPQRLAPPPAVQRVAGELRAGLRAAVAGPPPEQRGLVPGLVVGDTTALPASLVADFRTAGLTHLTAVSGANVAIVLGAVLLAARWLGVRAYALTGVGALALAGFVVLARPQPSVLRAAAMGLAGLVALSCGGRGRRAVPVLAAAVLALVFVDPWLSRSYGFVLSVLATAGLVVLAPGWRDRLARWLPRPVAEAVAVPAAAQAAVAPVIVLLSGQVSAVAIPANLLVAPAVAPATILGVLATTLAPVSLPLARLVALPAGWAAGWIVVVAERSAALPGAALPWPGDVWGAAVLALLTVAAVLLAPRLLRRPLPVLSVGAVLLAGVLLLPGAVRLLPHWPPAGWLLVGCDVGQGDALVLPAGPGEAVVVDAGPDPAAADRCLRDLGVRRIPLFVLTHFHADHVDGVAGVLRDRRVDRVWVSPAAEPAEQAAPVRRQLAAVAPTPVVVRPGVVLDLPGLRLTVLWPPGPVRTGESVPNDSSIVLLAETGGARLLLTGDIEPEAQRGLLAASAAGALVADVFKVPHHGSARQDVALVDTVRPRVAVVSVGADNEYGHPAPGTLAALTGRGALVLRTDRQGDVAVVGPAARLRGVVRRRRCGRSVSWHAEPRAGDRGPCGPRRRQLEHAMK